MQADKGGAVGLVCACAYLTGIEGNRARSGRQVAFCRYYNKTYALHEMLQHSKKLGLKTETEQRLLGLKQKIGDKANLNVKRFSLEPSAVLGGASEDDEGDDTEDELFPLPTSIPNRFATPSELEMPDNADSESDM